jgi:hypothetical protein
MKKSGDEVIYCMCGDAGDLNGDGYDDMVAIYRRAESHQWNHLTNEARMQVFYGSSSGLATKPALDERMNDHFIDSVSYEWYIVHGDFNGDGYSDVIVQCWSYNEVNSYFQVYHGSREGISSEPSAILDPMFSGYIITEPRVIDFDGDGYDDLGYQDRGHTHDHVEIDRTVVLRGSKNGLTTEPGVVVESRREASGSGNVTWVKFADVDADGMAEVVLINVTSLGTPYTYEGGSPRYKWKVDIEYHINKGGMLEHSPMVYETEFGWETFYPRIVSDFDGDGADDIVVEMSFGGFTPPGEPEIPARSRLWIIHGEGSSYEGEPVHLIGEHVLYAGHTSYDFHVSIDPLRQTYYDQLRLNLDTGKSNVQFSWHSDDANGTWFSPSVQSHAKVTSDPAVLSNETGGKAWVTFSILFDWDWPHEDPCDVTVEYLHDGEVKQSYTSEDLFRVENDLDLVGPLQVTGEFQGPLAVGDWVRGGERLTFTGPHVVYQGTTDVYPPPGTCEIVVYDYDRNHAKVTNPGDGSVNVTFPVVNRTARYWVHMMALQGLPGTAKGPIPREFLVNVDADAPRLVKVIPDGDEWISSSEVLMGITGQDNASGVDASTFEYSFLGTMGYDIWTHADVQAGSDGPLVHAIAYLTLPDGDDYRMRWRVRDAVGNRAVMSREVSMRIDTRNVTFTDPVPDEEVWYNSSSQLVGITIRDLHGSGIDVASIEYRVAADNASRLGPWTRYTGQHTDAREILVRVNVDLSDGPFNGIQWRAVDIAGNGPTVSRFFRVQIDTTPIIFNDISPKGIQHAVELEVAVEAHDGIGSGVDYDSIEYRYKTTRGRYTGWQSARIDTELTGKVTDGVLGTVVIIKIVAVVNDLIEGHQNFLQFRGLDMVGNGPSVSKEYKLMVDSSGPQIEMTSEDSVVHPEWDITFTVRVSDNISGVDIDRVSYRYKLECEDGMGEWLRIPVLPYDGSVYTGSVIVRFEPGRDNRIQFRCFDRMGNEALSRVYEVWVNRRPIALIQWPENGSRHAGGLEDALNGGGSADPDGDPLTYHWFIDGEEQPASNDSELNVDLEPGVHHIILIVKDPYGGWGSRSITVTVEESSTGLTTGVAALVVIVIVASIAAAATYIRWRRLDQ